MNAYDAQLYRTRNKILSIIERGTQRSHNLQGFGTKYGNELLSCVVQCSRKTPQSYNMHKDSSLCLHMNFCHVLIDALVKKVISNINLFPLIF